MRMRNLRFAAVIVAALICAGQVAGAQTVTLFANSEPSTPVDSDTAAVTLGVKFWSAQPGTVAGIRFYRGYKASSSGYTVKLFSAGGTLLASANTSRDTCAVPCWEQVNFASPISIAANTTYVAAYYTGNGRYAGDQYGLKNGATSGPLVAPASGQVGGNGVYTYSTGFPTQAWNASNYYVDISFTPSAPQGPQTPKAVSFSPAGPVNVSDTAPAGTAVAAIQVTTSDGNPFAGTLAISAQTANGMVSLSSSVLPSTVQVASINSSDVGTQTVSVQACENGTCTSPATLAMNVVANQGSASITGLSLSNTTFAGGAPEGTLVGNITVTTSDSSPPMLSLIGVQTGSGNDASSFRISSSQLLTNTATGATDQPGQYSICIVASGNYSNSPQQICPTIQATGPGGAGWQLTFSDEFNCPNNMLECLSTVPVSAYTWSNSFCSGLSSPSAMGCGALTVASLPVGISAANCTGTHFSTCYVSVFGATNSGGAGNAAVNGAFLVANVSGTGPYTINLYMPYSGITSIGLGSGTIVGSGPWAMAITNTCSSPPSNWPTSCVPAGRAPMIASNDNSGEAVWWDPHQCTVSGGIMLMTASTTGSRYLNSSGAATANYIPPASMQIISPPPQTACTLQTWPTFQQGFAFAQAEEVFFDYYVQYPATAQPTAWHLGNLNYWNSGPEMDIPECFGGGEGNCDIWHNGTTTNINRIGDTSFVELSDDVSSSRITTYQGGWGGTVLYSGTNPFPGTVWYFGLQWEVTGSSNNMTDGDKYQAHYLRAYHKVASNACYTTPPTAASGIVPHLGSC
jgi:hypothetical protein